MTIRLQSLCLSIFVLILIQPAKSWAQAVYEAENAQLAGGASSGSSNGVSYAEYITQRGTASVPGSSVAFNSVSVSETKTYAVDFRYSAARSWASSLSIYVNNKDVTQVLFPSTTSWTQWKTQTVALNLQAGINTIKVRYDADDSGWINIDYIRVRPETISAGYKLGAAPTATWFPKEISVDKFTGTAEVYLPLHTIQAGGIELPIGFAYSATGVKVNDRGNKVGVNWSLTGGVSISREVRGLPDDIVKTSSSGNRYGWLVYPANTTPEARINAVPNAPTTFSATSCTSSEATALQQLNQLGSLEQGVATRNLYDSEPDIFHYSLPGHSGKFIFDSQGNARTIPYDHITISPTITSYGISAFQIRTADGALYTFDQQERMTKKVVSVTTSPNCFLREYWYYKLPDTNQEFSYGYTWKASRISAVAGDEIRFTYRDNSQPTNPATSSRRIVRGATISVGTEEYKIESTTTKKTLEYISSPATAVHFNLMQGDEDEYYVQAVEIASNATESSVPPLMRKYLLEYQNAQPSSAMGPSWYDSQGNPITGYIPTRRFLSRIRLANGCSTQPLYSFSYSQLEQVQDPARALGTLKSYVALPPAGANDQDYWGFHTPNGSSTLIPKLYVYPQLAGQSPAIPGAPYRLYELATSTTSTGGFTLAGADRRPAACFDFQSALAGTLTTMTLPNGGKAVFEYEAHRFYDPIAEQSYPAGGTRIHAIRVQDPVTGIEARREYGYLEDDGRASGVLLKAPRFAFALPTTNTNLQQQWTDATVRCGEDLAEDLFESRAIGYHQVSEQMTGTGQVVTVYHVPGSADESTVAAETAIGINFSWARAVIGVARQTSAQNCPSVSPIQTGTELYPFAPATNYDFRRGLPQSVTYLGEPVNGTAATVRRETFTYEYRNLAPTRAAQVIGMAYEQLNSGTRSTYAYAKYPIITEFLYAVRHQTEVIPNGTIADNQTDTWYNYNAQGWLSAQGKTNSDGKGYRTRYKYLTDYPLTGTASSIAAGARFLAMKQRFVTEKISAGPVETISEIVAGPNEVRFAGATLNTFAISSQISGTLPFARPYQVLRWQPTGALTLASGYDSTRVVVGTAGSELHISPDFHVATTVLETNPRLVPLSTRTEAGRRISAVHLGYGETMPVLQISNSLASEVLFSDFESYKNFGFDRSSGATIASTAARTGQAGVALAANASLSALLPTSTVRSYRLSFWARPVPAASGASTITVTIAGGNGGTPPNSQAVSIASANNAWQLYEIVFDLAGIPTTSLASYRLQLLASAAVQVDDVLFLPITATAISTTYDVTKGKTSETDVRGRTVFYEYNVLGDLARVRDHNGAIVKQAEKIVAGRLPELSPSFTIEGSSTEGSVITFRANTLCDNSLSYSWNFGDGTSPAAQGPVSTHSFTTNGNVETFTITLSVSFPGQSKVYTSVQYIEIRPVPANVTSCVNGLKSHDICGYQPDVLENTCDASASPQTGNNTYAVSVSGVSNPVYTWRYREATGGAWLPMGQTSPSITIPMPVGGSPTPASQRSYQCTISNSNGVTLGVSDVFSVEWYSSRGTAENPCPVADPQ